MFHSKRAEHLTYFSQYVVPGLFVLLLTACGGAGSDSNFSTQSLGGGYSPGEVRPVVFGASNQAQIQFSQLSGDEKFALILFAANPDPSSFSFQLSGLNGSTSKALAQPDRLLPELPTAAGASSPEDSTGQLHENLREIESQLGGFKPYSPPLPNEAGDKAMAVNHPTCSDGSGVSFHVLGSLSNNGLHETVCGIEVRRTDKIIYYVDASALGSFNMNSLNGTIDEFEAKIPFERDYLGRESDVDQSGTFSVLFTPAVNRLGNSGGGFVTGYFFGGDLYPQSSVSGSNEQEVLFLCVPDSSGQWNVNLSEDFWLSNIVPSVLPHEYQHMISFNQHVLIHNDGAEEAWENEGLSHFMEDLRTDGSLDHVGMENPSRVSIFLTAPENAPFTSGISIAQRGATYLFLRYLYEQTELGRYPNLQNGADLMHHLLAGGTKGVANIEAATGWSFRNLLLDFYAAIQLSNTRISADPRYNFRGISLTAEQDDNRGTRLVGVRSHDLSELPFGGGLQSASALFFEISGQTIIDEGQGLSFSAPADMISGGIVIRLQ